MYHDIQSGVMVGPVFFPSILSSFHSSNEGLFILLCMSVKVHTRHICAYTRCLEGKDQESSFFFVLTFENLYEVEAHLVSSLCKCEIGLHF